MGWNKCSEQLPEALQWVLCADDNGNLLTAFLNPNGGWDDGDCRDNMQGITYWMALPKLPINEEK